MSARRLLSVVVLACAAGAVLALVAAGQPWEVVVTVRPAPLPELRTERTGGDRYPWLPALAWVGLAGAGALVATRRAARRLVGGLLALAGLGLAGLGLVVAGGLAAGWPALAGLGGLVVAGAGVAAVARGRGWPALGARYQRPLPAEPAPAEPSPDRPELLWDALDRGEDPTAR